MALDTTNTYTLLAAFEKIARPASFLKDRYFPTDSNVDIFSTDEVLIDYENAAGQKAAPFVALYNGTSALAREWFHTNAFKPPLLAPTTPMTVDDLRRRGFGEAVFNNLKPDERELALILKDLSRADNAIIRREELMAMETMTTDGCVMTPTGGTAHVIKFHDGDTNPYTYEPTTAWSESTANILGDIDAMAHMLTDNGLPATDLVMAGDVAADVMANPAILKLLDIRNVNIGGISPTELPPGATLLGTINVYGNMINLITYAAKYIDESGKTKPVLASGTVVCTAPAAGRGLYGCITQLEQADDQFHSYPGIRVPKYVADVSTNTRTLTLSAAPLLVPRFEGGWISANVHPEG